MSPDDDLMRCLDDQFARVHSKLDRILSEMMADFLLEYEALPLGESRRTRPALARDRGCAGAVPGGAAQRA
jgi:hypothetical protein